MTQINMPSARETLEQLPTEQLDEMLDRALHNEPVDENAIRLILGVLKEREKDYPVEVTPGIEDAWEKYRRDVSKIDEKAARPCRISAWLLKVASMAAVLILLVSVVPQQAQAESLWERLVRWTDSVFEFFSEDKQIILEEYEFQTDNPGLQQVYNAVTELGVTFPVVPMWLPEGSELIEIEAESATRGAYVYSRFEYSGNGITFKVNAHGSDVPVQYQKDEEQVKQIELHGTIYYVMRNIDRWVVAWSKENVECSFTIDCQEDTIYRILKSIYSMEDGI